MQNFEDDDEYEPDFEQSSDKKKPT